MEESLHITALIYNLIYHVLICTSSLNQSFVSILTPRLAATILSELEYFSLKKKKEVVVNIEV